MVILLIPVKGPSFTAFQNSFTQKGTALSVVAEKMFEFRNGFFINRDKPKVKHVKTANQREFTKHSHHRPR
jgi:hypothetical protein